MVHRKKGKLIFSHYLMSASDHLRLFRRTGGVFLLNVLLFGIASGSTLVRANDQTFQLEVPSQGADAALTALAIRFDITIAFDYQTIQQYQTNPLSGSYTAEKAIVELLRGTPLAYEFSDRENLIVTYQALATEVNLPDEDRDKGLLVRFLGSIFGEDAGDFKQIPENANDSSPYSNASPSIEEILVTGRKREERLVDVPVSISVMSSAILKEQGITGLQGLFDATPGLSYDEAFGDRNSSQPGIRGVQSDEIATTQQKVTTFIDGLPVVGQTASLGFFGVEQVEVYRGPQSAAFGRSTFAGAINYVTADATEEFEASFQGQTSTLDGNQIGLAVSGPITDSLGYRLGYVKESFTGPDKWTATDGIKTGTQKSTNLIAKLNFDLSDSAYAELMLSSMEQNDGPSPNYTLNPDLCQGDSGIYLRGMGARTQLFSEDWNCDVDSDVVRRNHDVLGDFIADYQPAVYGGLDLDSYLAQTDSAGVTYEQLLQIASVIPSVVVNRDRLQGELNFEVEDSLLTLMAMYTDEFYQRWVAQVNDSRAVISDGVLGPNQGGRSVRGSPVNIEEEYLEVRWASPENERLRYTLSGSYYAYDYRLDSFDSYGAIYYGLINESTGEPVDPELGNVISKDSTNIGGSFGVQYDLTERTTFSVEGRYQTDEVCGEDIINDFIACEETASFAPRIGINTRINEELSLYAQFSQGTNPAGVNIGFADPVLAQGLDIANGSMPVPNIAPDGVSVPGNTGVTYSDGSAVSPATVGYDADGFVTHSEESLTNFEIGAKGSFHEGRGAFSSALYYMYWEDLLSVLTLDWGDSTSIANGGSYNGWNYEGYWNDNWRSTLNVGDAVLYGAEIEATYSLSPVWSLSGNLALSSNKYSDFCSSQGPDYTTTDSAPFTNVFEVLTPQANGVQTDCVIADGKYLPKSHAVKGTLSIQAKLPVNFIGMETTLRGDYRYAGPNYVDDLNLLRLPGVGVTNLSATLRKTNLSLRLFINNLTNNKAPLNLRQQNRYVDNPILGDPALESSAFLIIPRRPREFGISLSMDF